MKSNLLMTSIKLYPEGEIEANNRLNEFINLKIINYKKERDFPSLNSTSILSPYLASGIISNRQCLNKALIFNENKFIKGNLNGDSWISELIWRDFFKYILFNYPKVCKDQYYKDEGNLIKWSNNKNHLEAWKNGKTGYPFVDAGMRQLLSTGYMHNRLRTTCASFLTKDLLINWKEGELHFSNHLIDLDFASNNGNWQYAGSTGTDPLPNPRIFNPWLQSVKFDRNGDFIREWVIELRDIKGDAIHDPFNKLSKEEFNKLGYPEPIVDHVQAKTKAEEIINKAFRNN